MTRAARARFPRNNVSAGRAVAAAVLAAPPINLRVRLIPLHRPSIIGTSAHPTSDTGRSALTRSTATVPPTFPLSQIMP